MKADIVNIGLSFLEGFALIISPCILPILPLILASSLTGSKRRPFGIIVGFVLIFSLFTFFSRTLVQYSGIDLNIIRYISYGILFLLGVTMVSTYLAESFSMLTKRLLNTGSSISAINNPYGGFVSGVLFGGLIAIIWTPCAGPILAAVIVQTVIQKTNLMSFLILIAFGIGTAVPMLLIVLFGRKIMEKFNFFKTHATFFRKLLGIVIIVSVGLMIYLENGISLSQTKTMITAKLSNLQNELEKPYPSPEINGITDWINSKPLAISELKGKVVLIDFWTYSCINCLRTLPYLKAWHDKYHNDGLVIIGVHTPEFDFEKKLPNVKNAVMQFGIKYPVALDNQFVTWLNFNNKYWPAHYLIDKKGNVVYTHFGEGDYDVTENNIRYLLDMKESATAEKGNQETITANITPETYLGFARAENFSSPEPLVKNSIAHYSFPKNLSQNEWALKGNWKIMPDRIISTENNAAIQIHFNAQNIYIVMGNTTSAIKTKLLLNGKNITINKGKDVEQSNILVDKHRLYHAISFPNPSSGILELISPMPGLEIYTFTFG